MMKRVLLFGAAVSMAAWTAFAGPYCGVQELPDLIKCLPAPPEPGSADFARDVARYEWGKEQRKDPERAALAKHDSVWSYETIADAFAKSFGLKPSPKNTPNIWKLLEDSLLTTDQMRVAPKAFYHRRRPFAYFNEEPLCPKEDGVWRDEGSYPSGHTLRSMIAALIFAEINPEKADEIFARAMQYGENRVIAGAHWQSDVDMTRLAAAIAYSRLQTIPVFRDQMKLAKGEFAAYKLRSGANTSKASAAVKSTEIRCEGEYPWHLQGVATDGKSIYWTFTTVLVKTDLTGKVQAKHEIARNEGHMGDLCCRDGKVYVGMNLGYVKGCRVGDEVWEYDASELKLLKKYPTPEAVWCNNGLEFHAGCFWVISSAPHHSRYNMVFRYTPDFKFMRCQMIDSGWTHLGVQTICKWGDKMLFGCYGHDKDAELPHRSCTLVVDGKALAEAKKYGEFPEIVPCEKRVESNTSEGMLVLNGQLMVAHGIRLSPPEDKQHQRWSARLRPLKLSQE